MDAITENHMDFAARIARIEKNVSASTQLLFVGVDEVYTMKRRQRKAAASRGRVLFGNFLYPVSLVTAVILGALSHGIGQLLRFYIQGVPDLKANPDVEMLVQIILGIVISMVLGFALGLNSRAFTTLKSFGVVCGMLFFHNAVHIFPRQFAAMTNELWVNQMLTHTKPFSLMWRGITFLL